MADNTIGVSLEPTAANIEKLKVELNWIDGLAQESEEQISALADAIRALLTQPDTGGMRSSIDALCQLIKDKSFDLMNTINSTAENYGANHTDEATSALATRFREAASRSRLQ